MNCDSFRFLSQHILQEIGFVNDALAFAGIYFVSKKLIKFNYKVLSFIHVHLWPRIVDIDLKDKYGGEWAVITGSSEGIGKAFAEELAKRQMNVVLISNDVKRLQDTALEINETYGVEVDFICITFDGDQSIYPKIKTYLQDKCIGVLVNNVGVMYDYPQMFLDVPSEMTHIILPDMVNRGKGAIINVAAGACYRPIPQMTVYAATKAYLDLFSRALHYEYKDHGITVQCLMPFYVVTRMQRFSRMLSKPSTLIPTANLYAQHAIQTLGYSTRTTGYWPHTLQAWLAGLIPEWLWMWGASRLNSALRRQAVDRLKMKSN